MLNISQGKPLPTEWSIHMKETLKKPYALVLLATAILSATATAIRAFLFLFRYDAAPGHFEPSALSDLLFPLLLPLPINY